MSSFHISLIRFSKPNRTRLVLCASLAVILLLSGCAATGQMEYQPRFDPLSATTFFPDGSSARPGVPNTVSYSADNSANSPINTGLDANGQPCLIEINTLPGLTPDFSDLCVIANASGICYRELILEILYLGASRWGLLEARERGGDNE